MRNLFIQNSDPVDSNLGVDLGGEFGTVAMCQLSPPGHFSSIIPFLLAKYLSTTQSSEWQCGIKDLIPTTIRRIHLVTMERWRLLIRLALIFPLPFFIRILFWNRTAKPLGPNPPTKLRNPFIFSRNTFLARSVQLPRWMSQLDHPYSGRTSTMMMQWWCTCDGAPLLTQPLNGSRP
jgi:hypothetical protein